MNTCSKANRGQFFTTNDQVRAMMASLLTCPRDASILEPSAGAGHLMKSVMDRGYGNVHGIELDPSIPLIDGVSRDDVDYMSFFAHDTTHQYDAVIGNPPYVAWKNVSDDDKKGTDGIMRRYSGKVNLYVLFIDSIIDHLRDNGQMVLIIPKEWMYATSAEHLRDKMMASGNITHIIDCSETKLFDDAALPTLMILRWVRTEHHDSRLLYAGTLNDATCGRWRRYMATRTGHHWMIGESDDVALFDGYGRLGDYWDVHVGMVSGADSVYRVSPDDIDHEQMMASRNVRRYITTRGIEPFIDPTGVRDFEHLDACVQRRLLPYHDRLIKRSIRDYDESNWWQWGAIRGLNDMVEPNRERFYCYGRTRNPRPFFACDEHMYSGGIFGIYKKTTALEWMSVDNMVAYMNSDRARLSFRLMGMLTGTRVSFQPFTLGDIPVPCSQE